MPKQADLDAVARARARGSERREIPRRWSWKTPEGIRVKPLYTAADLEGSSASTRCPGVAPFLRGPRATMYANRPWTIRQYARLLDRRGVQRVLPREPRGRAAGPLGRVRSRHAPRLRLGPPARASATSARPASRSTRVEDMKILFDGIPLDQMSVSMTMNGAVLPILAMLHRRGRRAGRSGEKLTGTIQNDILKEFMVRNTYIYPPEPSMRHRAPTSSPTPRSTCRSSTRSRSAAITCRRPARRGAGARLHARRRTRVRARGALDAGSRSTSSRRGSRSSGRSA